MKTYTLQSVNGTFTGSQATVSGSNDTDKHNIYVAFTQLDSGSLTIQCKQGGSSNWSFVGKVDLTGTEVAKFKLTGQIQDYRFVVAGASAAG